MSEENVQLLREGYAASNRGDFDFLRDHVVGDGFRYESAMTDRTYEGADALRRLFAEVSTDLADYRQSVERLIDLGDRVVALVWIEGVGRRSGVRARQAVATVWTFRDGRVVHGKGFPGHREGLNAAGL